MNLSQIKSDALAATQGEWTYSKQFDPLPMVAQVWKPDGDSLCELWVSDDDAQSSADARHIANMDPPTTIALVEEVDRLREALKPFAAQAEFYSASTSDPLSDAHRLSIVDLEDQSVSPADFTVGDIRRARQALGEDNEG